MSKITKAVIPAAGLGTRFLPATKALPKEMLPVVDKPAIQYVVEEAVSSGLEHVLMITGRNKNPLENHFDRAVELESLLEDKGDKIRLSAIEEATELADIHYVRQGNPAGLGHAISKAETFTGSEPFAVLLGDEIVKIGDDLLVPMLALAEQRNATIVALTEVSSSEISRYGVPAIRNIESDIIVGISGFVEKPRADDAPSSFAIIGRYVLQPSVYAALESVIPGVGGEIQLTDALNLMASDPNTYGPVIGYVFKGKRYDTGDKLSYLKAIVEIAVTRDDLGADFGSWLKQYVSSKKL
jgi:UTP--glucose-1-phosphate uridylyltransferase